MNVGVFSFKNDFNICLPPPTAHSTSHTACFIWLLLARHRTRGASAHGLSICIIRSSPSLLFVRLLSFYLSSFAAAARWSMYSSALSYTSSHSSSFAHCWQKAITWVGFGFRCSRLIPTLRLGYGSGGRFSLTCSELSSQRSSIACARRGSELLRATQSHGRSAAEL